MGRTDQGLSKEALHRAIHACDVNIVSMQNAIARERQTVTDYQLMIAKLDQGDPEIPYDREALRQNVDQCQTHMQTFEATIQAEEAKIRQYRWMIDQIDKKQAQREFAERAKIAVEASIKAQNDAKVAEAKRTGKRVVVIEENETDGDSPELL